MKIAGRLRKNGQGLQAMGVIVGKKIVETEEE